MSISNIEPKSSEPEMYGRSASLKQHDHQAIPGPTKRDLHVHVCADLWKHSIDYAQSVQHPNDPAYMTVAWTILLHAVRGTLDIHGLTEAVQNEYVYSISRVFSIPISEVEILAELKTLHKHLLQALTEKKLDIHTADGVHTAADILCDFAADEDNQEESPLATDQQIIKLMNTITHLQSSVSSLITQASAPIASRPATPAPAPKTSYTPPMQSKSNSSSFSGRNLATLLLSLTVVFILVVLSIPTSSPTAESSQTVAPTTEKNMLTELTQPVSGKILSGQEYTDGSEITVTASSGSSYVVSLKNAAGTTRVVFFVRAGETVTVGVPREKLYVYFASGDKWYGYKKGYMFGEHTAYSMDDEVKDFITYTWEYTLYPVTNGNFQETPTTEDSFF